MRVLVAPDKFKGSLSAKEVAHAIAAGVRAVSAEFEIDICPVADGGEGFLDCVRYALGGDPECFSVVGPYGSESVQRVTGRVLIHGDRGSTNLDAYIESADAIGHRLLTSQERNPERTDSRGLGSLVAYAVAQGCSRVFVGLGGSATVDGGIGLAVCLGARFFDAAVFCKELGGAGGALADIESMEPIAKDARVWDVSITALCDVSNTLLGANGAARVFGPQKGATPEQVERLEAGLANLVKVCRECGIACDPNQPGAGAAGGLGFGLATFLGATLVPGAPFILDLLRFDERVASADLVITGEGSFDSQTASGKACAEVASRAAKADKPCIVVAGHVDRPHCERSDMLPGVPLAGVHALTDSGRSPEECIRDAERLLQHTTRDAVLAWLGGKDLPH